MPGIVDLSYPIEQHFRWRVERGLASSFDGGGQFQATCIGFGVHGFTHIDAPRHILPDGSTTSDFNLEDLVGEAAVVDVSHVPPNSSIDAATLSAAGQAVLPNDRVLIKTAWDRRHSLSRSEFWTEAPYLTRDACDWLAAFQPRLVGFDFPQDRPIRLLLNGEEAPLEEFVSHDVLLRNGALLIEYLCNLALVQTSRTYLVALPLRIPGADGSPARVIAMP